MIECEGLVKIYKTSDVEVFALQGLDLRIEDGELTAIIGNSGSGKSTLLNMLGGLDRPSAGSLVVDGKNLLKMTDRDLVMYKRDSVGFVWQNNARNLVPYLTAQQNVELPMLLKGKRRRERSKELLQAVGLSHRTHNKLHELSGGEQQRVAIAIAMANNPRLLLADEPTGSLDSKMADQVLDFFRQVNRTFGTTVVIVTHDPNLAKKVDRVIVIRDGKISSEMLRKQKQGENGTGDREEPDENNAAAEEAETHAEYGILDKAGRVQIPSEYLDSLGLSDQNRVKIELSGGGILISPPVEE